MRRLHRFIFLFFLAATLVGGCFLIRRSGQDSNTTPSNTTPARTTPARTTPARTTPARTTIDTIDADRIVGNMPSSTEPSRAPGRGDLQPVDVSALEPLGIGLVYVNPGSFQTGSDDRTDRRMDDESPGMEVLVADPFLIGETEITRRQWHLVMGIPLNEDLEADLPISGVSFQDALDFCTRASATTSRTVRLPTEFEWEYAARAGTTTEYSVGVALTSDDACFSGGPFDQRRAPVIVKSFKPNPWGLYDVHGNVWEWCIRSFPSSEREKQDTQIARGGAWNYDAVDCRSSSRQSFPGNIRSVQIGFRVAVDLVGSY